MGLRRDALRKTPSSRQVSLAVDTFAVAPRLCTHCGYLDLVLQERDRDPMRDGVPRPASCPSCGTASPWADLGDTTTVHALRQVEEHEAASRASLGRRSVSTTSPMRRPRRGC